MKSVFAFLAGLAVAYGVSWIAGGGRRTTRFGVISKRGQSSKVDLNSATIQDLIAVGLDPVMANRVMESRPYRSKFDLVNRYVIGEFDYSKIKDRVDVSFEEAHEDIQIAS